MEVKEVIDNLFLRKQKMKQKQISKKDIQISNIYRESQTMPKPKTSVTLYGKDFVGNIN